MSRETLLLGAAGLIGALIGGFLGMRTEHGLIGIIAVAGAAVGLVAGVWVGQQMLSSSQDAE